MTIQSNPTILSDTMERPYTRRFLSPGHLVDSGLLTRMVGLGCYERSGGEAAFRPAPAAGCVPEDFYSSTHHRTLVYVQGRWREVQRRRMDAVVVHTGGGPALAGELVGSAP